MSLRNESFKDSGYCNFLVYSDKIYAIGKVEKNKKFLVKKYFGGL